MVSQKKGSRFRGCVNLKPDRICGGRPSAIRFSLQLNLTRVSGLFCSHKERMQQQIEGT